MFFLALPKYALKFLPSLANLLYLLLEKSEFFLRKQASNDPTLLENVQEQSDTTWDSESVVKTLAIKCDLIGDDFFYEVNMTNSKVTKNLQVVWPFRSIGRCLSVH